MFSISQQVMDRFEVEAAERAVRWHQDRLLVRFPDLSAIPIEQQYNFVRCNRHSAMVLGIQGEEDIAIFLDCAVMYGEDFVSEPWANEILCAEGLSGAERVWVLQQALAEVGISM